MHTEQSMTQTDTKDIKAWNPRFLAYCRSQGESDPDAMIALDTQRFPGGCMTGFSHWVLGKWREFDKMKGYGMFHVRTDQDHTEFDVWLAKEIRA
jgi:hypothetical protein